MRWIILLLAITFSFGGGSAAHGNMDAEAECQSLKRPNIDCSCVATRLSTFQDYAPDNAARHLIAETYRRELGLENDFASAIEQAWGTDMKDPSRQMATVVALDPIGGLPEDIEDLEEGCVIKDADPIEIRTPRTVVGSKGFSTNALIEDCMKSIGGPDGGQRYCQCTAERLTHRLTDREFEVIESGFIYNNDPTWSTIEEKHRLMARSMNMSLSAFRQTIKSGTAKLSPYEDRDIAYCSSRLWADGREGQSKEARLLAGFEPGIAGEPKPIDGDAVDITAGGPLDQARAIVLRNCTTEGNSDAYCQCYRQDFDDRIVSAASSEHVALSFALFSGEGGLDPMDYMNLMQSIPASAHQEAAMMSFQLGDIGTSCAGR